MTKIVQVHNEKEKCKRPQQIWHVASRLFFKEKSEKQQQGGLTPQELDFEGNCLFRHLGMAINHWEKTQEKWTYFHHPSGGFFALALVLTHTPQLFGFFFARGKPRPNAVP